MPDNTTKASNGLEVYENNIFYWLDDYSQKWQVDLHDIDLSRWNAVLLYINKNYFRNNPGLLKEKPYQKTNYNGMTNNNKYNMQSVKEVLSIYISICYEYSKEVSISGFCYLTGIDKETIFCWDRDKTNTAGSDVYKILQSERENSLSAKLYSSKGNPVGILGILNHFYGWNMTYPKEQKESSPKTIEQIQENYLEQKDIDTTNGEKTGDNRE